MKTFARSRALLLAAAFAFCAPGTVRAQTTPPDDAFRFKSRIGLWAMSADGDVGARGFESDVSADFGDIIENTNFALMPGFEVAKDNWVFAFNGVYAQLSADESFAGGGGVEIDATLGVVDLALGYTVVRTGGDHPLTITPAIGVRWTYLDLELDPARFESRSRDRNWFDPYIGAQIVLGLTDELGWRTKASIGGFDVGSDLAWSAETYLDYQFARNWEFNVGYRAYSWDYEEDDFVWDVVFHGPWVGVSYLR